MMYCRSKVLRNFVLVHHNVPRASDESVIHPIELLFHRVVEQFGTFCVVLLQFDGFVERIVFCLQDSRDALRVRGQCGHVVCQFVHQ